MIFFFKDCTYIKFTKDTNNKYKFWNKSCIWDISARQIWAKSDTFHPMQDQGYSIEKWQSKQMRFITCSAIWEWQPIM